MKNNTKAILSTLIVIVLLIISIFKVTDILKPIFIGDSYNSIDAFYEQPKNSFDVIVYGSSHAWKGFDTAELSNKYGFNAWNYGGNWQKINTTKLFFEDSLISQNPKVVLIEAFSVSDVHENTTLNGEILYTNHLRWSDAKLEYLKQVFGDNKSEYISYFFPLIYFHSNWNNLEKWSFINITDDYDFTKNKGYFSSFRITPVKIKDYKTFRQKPLSKSGEKILKDIVKKCKERGIKIVFYLVPYEGEYAYRDAMKKFAKENDCYYVDFFEKMEEANLNVNTDFQDSAHLNDSGSKKVANYMGKYIIDNLKIGKSMD